MKSNIVPSSDHGVKGKLSLYTVCCGQATWGLTKDNSYAMNMDDEKVLI